MTFVDLTKPQDNEALKDIILDRIRSCGPISFADFMSLALYHPKYGYYLSSDPERDFQTSPQVHPIFGAAVGRSLADMWRAMGRPARFEVFEAGAGDGQLAADILRWAASAAPDFYDALDYSLTDPRLSRRGGEDALERAGVPGGRVTIRAEMPGKEEIEGCIISN